MLMTLLHVVMGGGLVAFVGGAIAQVDPNGNAGQAGWLLGLSGIVTAIMAGVGTIGKAWIDHLEKERAEETTRLRITLGNDRTRRYTTETREYLEKLAEFIARIPGCPPGIPDPPPVPEHRAHHDISIDPNATND